jgi:hypothetical protein
MINNSYPLSEIAGSSNKTTSTTKSDSERAAATTMSSQVSEQTGELSNADEEQEPRQWSPIKGVQSLALPCLQFLLPLTHAMTNIAWENILPSN